MASEQDWSRRAASSSKRWLSWRLIIIVLALYLITTFFGFRDISSSNAAVVKLPTTSPCPKANSDPPLATDLPRKIWQTSKIPTISLDDDDKRVVQTWLDRNPEYRHEILTAGASDTFVQDRYASTPEIQEIFLQLRDPILRADLIRYLVLSADGGIYNDIDVQCLQPIENWGLPKEQTDKASVIVGIEVDRKLEDGSWRLGFCSWTIMAKPNHPAINASVSWVLNNLKALAAAQKTSIGGIKASREDVIATTGPRAFSQSLYAFMSQSTGTKVSYLNFTGLVEPKLVAGVLVLPINSFGSGQAHSGSGSPQDESALVQHLWKGSWKPSHPDQ